MNNHFRLSRIAHPRATFWAVLLLAAVFLSFGVVAEASMAASELACASTVAP